MIGFERFQELSERRSREARQRNDVFDQPLTGAEEAIVDILAGLPRARVVRLVSEAAKLRRANTDDPCSDS